MASATTPLCETLTIAHSCRLSLPFASKAASFRFVSVPAKPRSLHFSCSFSPSPLVAAKARPRSSSSLARVSDWDTTTVAGEETEAVVSEWESEGEDAGAAAASASENGEGDAGFEEEGGYVEPPEEAKLFVGNLPYDVDSQRLAMLFEKAGVVEISEVIYNRDTDRSRGFGFVTMSTVEEADKAVEMFNRYDLDGRLLTVNKASPRGERAEQPPRAPRSFESAFRIYVGNLPWDTDNGRLEQIFSEHGKVVEARVVYDRETGRSRGFGFVMMSSEAEMEDAIAALDGQSLDGRAIRVNVAEERPRRTF